MDAAISSDAVPERRTKSWKREHEETCTRRYLSCYSNVQKVPSVSGSDDSDGRSQFPVESSDESVISVDKSVINETVVPCCDIDINPEITKPTTEDGVLHENDRNTPIDDIKRENVGSEISESKDAFVTSVPKRHTVKFAFSGGIADSNIISSDRETARKSGSQDNCDPYSLEKNSVSHVKSSRKLHYERSLNEDNSINNIIKVTNDKRVKYKSYEASDLKYPWEGKSHASTNFDIKYKNNAKYDMNIDSVNEHISEYKESMDCNALEQKGRETNSQSVKKGFDRVDEHSSNVVHVGVKDTSMSYETNDSEHVKLGGNLQKKKSNETDNKLSLRDRVRTEDMSETSTSVVKHFSKEQRASSHEVSYLPDTVTKDCVAECTAPSSQNDSLERTIIPGILREIKENAYRETQVTSLETYISGYDISVLTLSNDTIGLCVGSNEKVNVVMPRQKMKLEDKLTDTPNDPEYQEKILLLSQIVETEQRIAVKDVLRSFNNSVASQRPDDRYFTKLDSSLKKNTAFVRKLKTFTGNQLENLMKEFLSLNLTKYVSEVATALVEAKLKMTDVWPAVQLCNIFHGTYSEFSVHLLDNWHKVLTIKKDEKIANAAKLRVDIRFYAELINVGIFTHKEGLPLMGNVLTMLTHSDKDDHLNINILLSFCRHCGDEYAGLVPRKMRELCEKYSINLPRYKLLPKEKQRNVKALLKDYFNSMCKHLLKEHLELQSFIRQNKKILQTKGELSSERKERLEVLQTSFDRIANGTQQFAEALDEDLPPLPEDESLKSETLILNGSSESEEGTLTASLWEDEETRRFYEYLPDMKEFMPSLQVRVADPEPQISEETLDAEFEGEFGGDNEHEEEVTLVEIDESEDIEPVGNPSNKILLDAFLTALPNCINREMIDSAAVDFVMTLNTKHNRRKLVKTLFNVPRIRLDLLPFYARLVATLHPVMPDVATDLAQMLKQDFKYHIRKKDQMNIESKIKIVRFIGELVKFRMYSKIEGLYCVKVLVQDFTHHHIEMCCNLLESCGRFFFRHPDCHQRMKVYLDQMMRKKAVMALDSRYVTMIENAYYYVNPPESTQCVAKERPVEHQFIRKILYQMLMKSNTDKVLRLMRKLDWNDIDTHSYSVKCLTYAFKVKYFNIRCLASLLAGLATQQETVGAQVVDGVLEDIRLGMEVNLPKYNQRRVAMIKYLGELYNYRMLESSNIFQVLYSLITFGVTWEHENQSPLDPPDNLFRIRLVCVLLETCGQYFISGMSKKKLDIFLVYFQHYFWFKFSDPTWNVETPFPVGINYMYKDTITSLRPNIHLFTSYSEATEAVTKLKMEESSTLFPQSQITASELKEESEENIATAPEESNSPILDETAFSKSEIDDINDDEEEEEEYGMSGDNVEREPDDDEDEDLTEPLSGDVDGDMDWVANGDASHMSEGDSQSQEIPLPVDSDGISYGPKLLECPEDEDFLTAFDRMVSDNIQDRMRETVKPQQVDISVPLHIKGNAKKTYDQLREEEPAKSSVNFILMLRKGHKQQYKSLEVPVNSEMALNLKNREEAERAEKERVKRLTLDINERLEEEDYQEMLAQAQRPVVMNLNRERRHKYQHPKGAPDADLIFGPKKVQLDSSWRSRSDSTVSGGGLCRSHCCHWHSPGRASGSTNSRASASWSCRYSAIGLRRGPFSAGTDCGLDTCG